MISISYADYLAEYSRVPDASEEIVIDVTGFNLNCSEGNNFRHRESVEIDDRV